MHLPEKLCHKFLIFFAQAARATNVPGLKCKKIGAGVAADQSGICVFNFRRPEQFFVPRTSRNHWFIPI
jgi:hypothetical protein